MLNLHSLYCDIAFEFELLENVFDFNLSQAWAEYLRLINFTQHCRLSNASLLIASGMARICMLAALPHSSFPDQASPFLRTHMVLTLELLHSMPFISMMRPAVVLRCSLAAKNNRKVPKQVSGTQAQTQTVQACLT